MNVDAACITGLKNLLGDDYALIAGDFFKSSQSYIETIGTEIAKNNRQAISFAAHKLTSSSGQFGLTEVQTLAKVLEYNSTLDAKTLSQIFEKMQIAYTQALDHLRTANATP